MAGEDLEQPQSGESTTDYASMMQEAQGGDQVDDRGEAMSELEEIRQRYQEAVDNRQVAEDAYDASDPDAPDRQELRDARNAARDAVVAVGRDMDALDPDTQKIYRGNRQAQPGDYETMSPRYPEEYQAENPIAATRLAEATQRAEAAQAKFAGLTIKDPGYQDAALEMRQANMAVARLNRASGGNGVDGEQPATA